MGKINQTVKKIDTPTEWKCSDLNNTAINGDRAYINAKIFPTLDQIEKFINM